MSYLKTDNGKNAAQRLHWLDILRGIAALSIVIWHWPHFFMHGHVEDLLKADKYTPDPHYPLFRFLRPLYGQGWRAVQFFFTLSGFIFFWLYSEKIVARKINFGKYLALRFSRLYPLHWLTLLVVIAGQMYIYRLEGTYFVYNNFSLGAFIGNATLTLNWFTSDFAFNGPSWSVSVEMLLYLIFFALCYNKLNRWWCALLFVGAGYLLRGTMLDQAGSGLMSFFMGGIVYQLYSWFNRKIALKKRIWFSSLLLPTVLFSAISWRYILHREPPLYFFELWLFPVIILTTALLETAIGSGPGKRLSFIGDISFSSYLWHFPLQILFAIGADRLRLGRAVFYSPLTLGLFYVVLISVSLISYYKFEHPFQHYLRKKLISPPSGNDAKSRKWQTQN